MPILANAWLDRMLAFWSPGWTLGGIAAAACVGVALRKPVARCTGIAPTAAVVYILVLGAAVAVTASPRSSGDTYFVFGPAARSCEIDLRGRDLGLLLSSAEWQFNLVLLAPVGWVCASAPRARARGGLLLVALSVAVGIEAAQWAITSLHRVCQSLDVVTNGAGLALGYLGGRAWRWTRRNRAHEMPVEQASRTSA